MKNIVHVVAHIEAAEGQEELVREVLEGYLAPTRAEKGCLRYDLFAEEGKPGVFTFIEEWETIEDLKQHAQSEHLKVGRARLEGKTAKPNWVQVLRQVG